MKVIIRAVLATLLVLYASMALAQSEYRLRAGDTVNIEVLEDPTLNRSVVVLPDGRISYPLAGSVTAAGRTVEQLRAAITGAISDNFAAAPNVFVGVQPGPRTPRPARAARMMSVYLIGEVANNGRIEVRPGTTFLQALAEAGGTTPFAATKRVQLRRTDPNTNTQQVFRINYRALLEGAEMKNDVPLRDGDVIIVPERRLFE